MKDQQKTLIKLSVWCAIILFVLRYAISWKSLMDSCSLYDLFGYASEAIGATAILAILYERFFWKFNPFENTPKLATKYTGTLKSNHDNEERQVSLIIKQTLLSLHITMVTDESKSKSISASINDILGEKQLIYCYLNIPKSEYRDRSEIHYGTAILSISNPKEINGQYYTDRKTIGDMSFFAEK